MTSSSSSSSSLGSLQVRFLGLNTSSSTSFTNIYKKRDGDERQQEVWSTAPPFSSGDVDLILQEQLVHSQFQTCVFVISSLYFGEFPETLLSELRNKLSGKGEKLIVAGDIQGWLRHVNTTAGTLSVRKWEAAQEFMRFMDVLKVDDKEVGILTGLSGSMEAFKEGIRQVRSLGSSIILATYLEGIIVFDGDQFYEARFGVRYTAEGRTGRGDTCTAAFLVARFLRGMSMNEATEFAAQICARKMQYPGPYNGN